MNILFLGDIVGKVGRNVVINNLQSLKEKYAIDFTIINGENAAHGKGITSRIYNQLMSSGANCITMGNHTFSKSELKIVINDLENLIRPMNLDPINYGQAYKIYNVNGLDLCVCNISGSIFMDRIVESPFTSMDKILENTNADLYLVDFHAETTSEKITFANYYSNDLVAVLGTHTHVQTADERIINNLAFISDVGMCGAFDSVLGRDTDEVIRQMVYHEKTSYTVSENDAMLCGVVINIDEKTKKAKSINRIQIRPNA